MHHIEKTIFLSYRRTGFPWALAIFQNLTHHGYDVFFDYNGLASGDFERVILENIKARAHFLLLLTPTALERCNDPQDWLRREIETALQSQRNIIPLMFDSFTFDDHKVAARLTGTLASLRRYNGLNVPAEYFDEAMDRLRTRYLNVALAATLHPSSTFAQTVATEQKAAALTAPKVLQDDLSAQQWFEKALSTSDANEGLQFYAAAVRLKPDLIDVLVRRAITRKQKGDANGALQDFSAALRYCPNHIEALHNRAFLLFQAGDFEGAIKDCTEIIRYQPNDAYAYHSRACARMNGPQTRGVIEAALEDYTTAITLDAQNVSFLYDRGRLRNDEGDPGAADDFDEVLRFKPDHAGALRGRASTRLDKKDIAGALRDLNEAIRLEPSNGYAFRLRGQVQCKKGDLERALSDYNEAVRIRPDDGHAYYGRAEVREAMGDNVGAVDDKEAGRRLNPSYRIRNPKYWRT